MELQLLFALLAFVSSDAGTSGRPPIANPVVLNIGFVCRWRETCMKQQQRAMNRSLKYVRKYKPPAWKVQLCNRNASRKRTRVDWIGFENCVRNPALKQPVRRKRR